MLTQNNRPSILASAPTATSKLTKPTERDYPGLVQPDSMTYGMPVTSPVQAWPAPWQSRRAGD